jgi:hypothetical protein
MESAQRQRANRPAVFGVAGQMMGSCRMAVMAHRAVSAAVDRP